MTTLSHFPNDFSLKLEHLLPQKEEKEERKTPTLMMNSRPGNNDIDGGVL